jgi:hypothetical protein
MGWLAHDPAFDALRGKARYLSLVARLGAGAGAAETVR